MVNRGGIKDCRSLNNIMFKVSTLNYKLRPAANMERLVQIFNRKIVSCVKASIDIADAYVYTSTFNALDQPILINVLLSPGFRIGRLFV